MRILHVSDTYLPRLGGIELHVHDLAAEQRALGYDVTVATSTAGPAGGSTVRLTPGAPYPFGRARPELNRLIGSGGFDVVHAHSSLVSPVAWSAATIAAASGTPAVVTMHSMVPVGVAAPGMRAALRGVPTGVHWTAVSTAAAAALQAVLGIPEVAVLPNGIDPDKWAPRGVRHPGGALTPAGGALPHAGGALTIVSVMRMARRKRPLPLLKILATIRRLLPARTPLRAVLVGSGPQDAAVHRRIAGSGLRSWVTHAGRLSRTEIQALLERSDLYLAPATLESFGIAALEAHSAGLPVIGMAGGGLSDFVDHGTDGLLVDSDAAMAVAAAHLLGEPMRLRRMQQHLHSTPPSVTWPQVLELHRRSYVAAGAVAPVPITELPTKLSRSQPSRSR